MVQLVPRPAHSLTLKYEFGLPVRVTVIVVPEPEEFGPFQMAERKLVSEVTTEAHVTPPPETALTVDPWLAVAVRIRQFPAVAAVIVMFTELEPAPEPVP